MKANLDSYPKRRENRINRDGEADVGRPTVLPRAFGNMDLTGGSGTHVRVRKQLSQMCRHSGHLGQAACGLSAKCHGLAEG